MTVDTYLYERYRDGPTAYRRGDASDSMGIVRRDRIGKFVDGCASDRLGVIPIICRRNGFFRCVQEYAAEHLQQLRVAFQQTVGGQKTQRFTNRLRNQNAVEGFAMHISPVPYRGRRLCRNRKPLKSAGGNLCYQRMRIDIELADTRFDRRLPDQRAT